MTRTDAAAARVVVVGMHRSGTSALTSLLVRMGFHAGSDENLDTNDEHNPRGYWEHRQLHGIDEELLAELGGSWHDVLGVDPHRLGEPTRIRFAARARALLGELDGHGPWVFKDPRLCVLLSFWRPLLEDPVCVMIHRDPLAVARSLAFRDEFPLPVGIALWELHNLAALAGSQGLRRVLVSYRELLADPAGTAARLRCELEALGVPGLERLQTLTPAEAGALIEPHLEHHRGTAEERPAYLNELQRTLLEALENGSALALEPVPELSASSRELLIAHATQARDLLRYRASAAESEARYAELDRLLRQREREQSARLTALEEALAAERVRSEQFYDRLVGAEQERSGLAARLQQAEQTIADEGARLAAAEQTAGEQDELLGAVFASRSWRFGFGISRMIGLGRRRLPSAVERWRELRERG